MKQSGRLPEGGIPYRKNVFIENPEYNVLTILEMKQEEKEHAIKKVSKLYSKVDALEFVKQDVLKRQKKEKNDSINYSSWSYSDLDLHGRVGVLKYKMIEIALFYQRQLTKRRINHENPVSELKLKDPADAWVRCDLWGLSTKQNKQSTVNLIQQQEKKLEQQERTIATKQALIEQLESNLKRYQKKRRKYHPLREELERHKQKRGHKNEKQKSSKREAKSKRKYH